MRTNLVISLVLLVLTIGCGWWEETQTEALCERYVSAAKELRIMAEKADWLRAEETVSAYKADWESTTPWLQVLINHDDIDDVTLSLTRLEAVIAAREQGQCYEICAELEENARHIHHRDNFTLGNVL